MAFGRFRATLLKALAQGMHPLASLLDGLTAKGFACTIGGDVHDAQIDAEGPLWFGGGWLRNIKCYGQIERAIAMDEIGLLMLSMRACW